MKFGLGAVPAFLVCRAGAGLCIRSAQAQSHLDRPGSSASFDWDGGEASPDVDLRVEEIYRTLGVENDY